MFGNLNLLLGSVALAVVITTLFVAGNTMAMSVRERTTEIAVMRTLGFPARDDLRRSSSAKGWSCRSLGGAVGAALARVIVNGETLGLTGGFIPAFGVNNAQRWSSASDSARSSGCWRQCIPAIDGLAARRSSTRCSAGLAVTNLYGTDQPATTCAR